jgi:hypothetical protein
MIINTAVNKLAATLMEADQHQAMVDEAIAAAGFTKDNKSSANAESTARQHA